MWQAFFGRGLVGTSDDFGTRGERPTHPELLDWLAVEFPARGWSQKAMHRLIVTSATYRQASRADARPACPRPEERSCWPAGPRFRVEAETVRDIALAASGLLNPQARRPQRLSAAARRGDEPRLRPDVLAARARAPTAIVAASTPSASGPPPTRPSA